MNTRIKHTAVGALLLCAGFASMHSVIAQERAQEQRPAVTVDKRAVGAFSAIELAGPFRVIVSEGAPRLELTGEAKQLAEIESEVRGGTLIVRQRSRSGIHFSWGKRNEQPVVVRIGASGLKSLASNGSGDVELESIGGERFVLAAQGPGDIRARGTVRDLRLTSSGSGDLELRGVKAANVELAMSGPGDVHLGAVGNDLAARVSGSGDVEVDELRVARAVAQVSGPGSARLRGSARDLRVEVTGSGDFDGCKLDVEKVSSVQRGPGSVCVAGTIRQFEADVHGSGDLEARGLAATRATLRMSGPGSATLSGSADELRANLSGSGELEADRLTVKTALIDAGGPGDVSLAKVTDTLDASLHGSGDLTASIDGKRVMLKMRGPGTLQARRLTVRQTDINVRGPGSANVNLVRDGEGGRRDELVLVERGGRRQAD